ncbi:anti-sigma-28 factor, FlgM family [Gracilibacillus ureilyticus]|uniref:Negative regulator of flagellin synthesis n=1 Tax=Gracilibacillus ureilyticus TaxID=531814 RepID=A0A1H9NY10_9BACI|nr:flagellar biosynthesis anti-sigma factor FlgM [Gracilibacillus ureilyticus]SER40876.1 anti-sigma-28 factor, FlgM family [Gracilibacillus ureilyticus]
MKINGPNQSKINPYQNQQYTPKQQAKQTAKASDQLEISNKAKQMQSKDSRQSYVNEIKQQVEQGEYKPNLQETAKKLLNFWKA